MLIPMVISAQVRIISMDLEQPDETQQPSDTPNNVLTPYKLE